MEARFNKSEQAILSIVNLKHAHNNTLVRVQGDTREGERARGEARERDERAR